MAITGRWLFLGGGLGLLFVGFRETICAAEIHIHLLRWWVGCGVFRFVAAIDCVIFVIQEFDCRDNFCASSRQH